MLGGYAAAVLTHNLVHRLVNPFLVFRTVSACNHVQIAITEVSEEHGLYFREILRQLLADVLCKLFHPAYVDADVEISDVFELGQNFCDRVTDFPEGFSVG